MVVERAFGILKGRWRILLKRIDMPFHPLLDIIIVALCLYNLCTIHGDAFNMDWAREVKMEMQTKENGKLGIFQKKTCSNAIK
jgi:hypothetical protein